MTNQATGNRRVANLTQHDASPEQLLEGVFDLPEAEVKELKKLLAFTSLPSEEEVNARAAEIAAFAVRLDITTAMVGGVPVLMGPLEAALKARGIAPWFAFSQRVSVDNVQKDGSVVKTSVFKHEGFTKKSL